MAHLPNCLSHTTNNSRNVLPNTFPNYSHWAHTQTPCTKRAQKLQKLRKTTFENCSPHKNCCNHFQLHATCVQPFPHCWLPAFPFKLAGWGARIRHLRFLSLHNNNSYYDKKDVCAASYPGIPQDDFTKAAAVTLARDKATPSPSTRVEPPVIPALQQTYSWGLGFRNSTLSKYILPKSTRDFAKARPIVHYSTA